MEALRWHGRGDVRLDDVELGPPAPGEVQLQVLACGICGTDVEEYLAGPIFIPVGAPHPLTGRMAPLTLGHEFCGKVIAVGEGLPSNLLGDRLAVDGLSYCGNCRWCRQHRVNLCESLGQAGLTSDGGLAEACNVPLSACLPIPPGVSDDDAALAETLAVGVRALRRGSMESGQRVAIVGAGAVGLLCLQAALAAGAGSVVVVEPEPERRQLALRLGAAAAVPPEEAATAAADLVVECSGSSSALATAVAAAARAAAVVLVGVHSRPSQLDTLRVVIEELSIVGSLSHVYDLDYAEALRLLAAGAVLGEPVISDRLRLSDCLELGLKALAANPGGHLKIVVHPQET